MMSIGENSRDSNNKTMIKRTGKRPGRKPSKIDERAKLERSRQSARECRARKKLRYQYLEELVLNREKAVFALRDEMETYKQWCFQLENGGPVPDAILKMIAGEDISASRRQTEQIKRSLLQQDLQFSSSSSSTISTPSASPQMSPLSHLEQSHSQFRQLQTLQPQSVSTDSHRMATHSQSMSTQQQGMSSQPHIMSSQTQFMSTQPQSLSLRPQNLLTQSRSMSSQLQGTLTQPQITPAQPQLFSVQSQRMSLQSQGMSLQSQRMSLPPQSLSIQSQRMPYKPHSNLSQSHIMLSQPQILSTQSSNSSPLHGYLESNSSLSKQQDQQLMQNQQHLQGKQTATPTTSLQRQIAFDHSHLYQNLPQHQPQFNEQSTSFLQQTSTHGNVPLKHAAYLREHHRQDQQHVSSTPQINSIRQAHNFKRSIFPSTSQDSSMSAETTKMNTPVRYAHSFDGFETMPNFGQINSNLSLEVSMQDDDIPIRRRSLSNPATMNSFPRGANQHVTSAQDLPTPLQEFITSHSSSSSTSEQTGQYLGLFTGSLFGTNRSLSSSNIPTSITVEDSNSSDESTNEKMVHQSSLTSQSRTTSNPYIFGNNNSNRTSMTSSTSNYNTQNSGLTAAHSLDFTANSSIPASLFGGATCNTPSPTTSFRYSGLSTSTPSSSNTASPVPLSSLSSILEFCTSLPIQSSTTFSHVMDTTTQSMSHHPHFPSSTNIPSTGLTSFMPESIPDWYSFLADLEDGTMSTVTPGHLTSSSQNSQTVVTSNQPMTSNPTFMNVPNIIDEILDCSD